MTDMARGWALEAWAGVFHFQPISEDDADHLIERREDVYVVETVSYAEKDGDNPQLNQYFVVGLSAAIGMAAKLLGDLREFPEEIVAIRAATPDEVSMFEAVVDHFDEQIPPAISDDDARKLVRGKGA